MVMMISWETINFDIGRSCEIGYEEYLFSRFQYMLFFLIFFPYICLKF